MKKPTHVFFLNSCHFFLYLNLFYTYPIYSVVGSDSNFFFYTGMPHLIALHKYHTFYRLKFFSNPVLSESVNATFLRAFFSLPVSVSNFGNSCNVRNVFVIILVAMVICDQ